MKHSYHIDRPCPNCYSIKYEILDTTTYFGIVCINCGCIIEKPKIIVTTRSEEFEHYAQVYQKVLNYFTLKIRLWDMDILTQEIQKQYFAECFKCCKSKLKKIK